MKLKEMGAAQLGEFLHSGCDNLCALKEEVNALNVFPVPDGDTGINMYLTIASAVKNIDDQAKNPDVGKMAYNFSLGALMGARGNSGVILSQIFRGFSQSIGNKKTINAHDFAVALQKGVNLSYKSVMKPREGTILTVFKDFAAAANTYAEKDDDIIAMLRYALEEGDKSLENTPNLLPVLKQAGVVDAGGKGILVIMEGGLSALLGQKITAQTDIKDSSEKKSAPADTFSLTEEIEFGYCTEFFILGKNIPVEKIKNYYTKNIPGDSLIVVGMEDFVKVHFHSNAPWKILEYASSFGDLNDIKIDNMRCQNQKLQAKEAQKAEETPQKTAQTSQEATKIQSVEEEKVKCGVLSVCAGDGMSEIFRKMGVKTLGGGQTMNPSAEEIINAINEMSADEIIILPNNSNIILTAKQAQKMVKKPIVVLESKFMTQGLGAMLNYDKNLSAKENAKEMKESMAVVQSAEITFAVRDSQYQDIEIKANDLLALQEGKIIFTGHDLQDTISLLLEKMMAEAEDPSIISLFYGHDVDEKQALAIAAHLESIYDELDIECLYGGQPLYYFLISLE